ncbi:DUF488 domain-containing protein [Pseudonocardia acaciae]|uniref:DUF488 domain-containing protein n=1 Tax=Pseudonocardia acaciae TaxID=551276 RepID=UPI0004909850|nr:DUF488 family protein [Pseudonocardia acaciae]
MAEAGAGIDVRVRRVYDPREDRDGHRVLVDRLWPRGLTKERAHLDTWLKDVAPSSELRTWYGHDPERFAEFDRRYRAELEQPERGDGLRRLRELARTGPLTLLTATKQPELSQAAVLADILRERTT